MEYHGCKVGPLLRSSQKWKRLQEEQQHRDPSPRMATHAIDAVDRIAIYTNYDENTDICRL